MARQDIFTHTGLYLYRREDFLGICNGNQCAAELLDLFEYWTGARADEIKRVQEYNRRAVKESFRQKELDYWLYESIADFKNGLLNGYGDTIIKAQLKWLQEVGFIESKAAPHGFDRTKLYRLNIQLVQQALTEWHNNQKPDPLKMITEESELTARESEKLIRESELTIRESELCSTLYISNSQLNNQKNNQSNQDGFFSDLDNQEQEEVQVNLPTQSTAPINPTPVQENPQPVQPSVKPLKGERDPFFSKGKKITEDEVEALYADAMDSGLQPISLLRKKGGLFPWQLSKKINDFDERLITRACKHLQDLNQPHSIGSGKSWVAGAAMDCKRLADVFTFWQEILEKEANESKPVEERELTTWELYQLQMKREAAEKAQLRARAISA